MVIAIRTPREVMQAIESPFWTEALRLAAAPGRGAPKDAERAIPEILEDRFELTLPTFDDRWDQP